MSRKYAHSKSSASLILAVFLTMGLAGTLVFQPIFSKAQAELGKSVENARQSGKPMAQKSQKSTVVKTLDKSKVEVKPPKPASAYKPVTPIDLLKAPDTFMKQSVTFEGTFNSFSSLGLDYKKAMRDSKEHITMLINRPDVKGHTIPLSELKLIYPRQKSEAVMKLESGDKIRIQGTVFSTALNEPWLDVEGVEVLEKVKKETDEDTDKDPECC